MSNKYIFFFVLIFGTKTFAQPALTNAYFPQVGKSFSGRSFSKVTPLPPIAEGANKTWNFAGLDSVYITEYDFAFRSKNVADTDSGIFFPGAQSAIVSYFGTDSIENFYKIAGTDLQNIGYNLKGAPVSEKFSIPRVDFRAGLNFAEPFINQSRCAATVAGYTWFKKYRDTISYAGYGTLITPFATYNNVVLLKNNFSIEYNFTEDPNGNYEIGYVGKSWQWYLPGFGVPYVKYSEEIDLTVPEKVFYEGYVGFIPVPVSNKKSVSKKILITPTILRMGEELKFSGLDPGQENKIYLWDMQGKRVFAGNLEGSTLKLPILKTGIYSVSIETENDVQVQKIIFK